MKYAQEVKKHFLPKINAKDYSMSTGNIKTLGTAPRVRYAGREYHDKLYEIGNQYFREGVECELVINGFLICRQ